MLPAVVVGFSTKSLDTRIATQGVSREKETPHLYHQLKLIVTAFAIINETDSGRCHGVSAFLSPG